MANMRQVAGLGVTVTAAAVYMAPRDIVIPQEYKIAKVVERVLFNMQKVIDATEGKSFKNVDRLVNRILHDLTRLIKYVIVEPLIALAYLVEKLVRMDFRSANEMSRELLERLTNMVTRAKDLMTRLRTGLASVEVSAQNLKALGKNFGEQNQTSSQTTAQVNRGTDLLDLNATKLSQLTTKIEGMETRLEALANNPDNIEKLGLYNGIVNQLVQGLEQLTAQLEQSQQQLSNQSKEASAIFKNHQSSENQALHEPDKQTSSVDSEFVKAARHILDASEAVLRVIATVLPSKPL